MKCARERPCKLKSSCHKYKNITFFSRSTFIAKPSPVRVAAISTRRSHPIYNRESYEHQSYGEKKKRMTASVRKRDRED